MDPKSIKSSLTDTEYRVLCELFHEYNDAFKTLSDQIKSLYYKRLYQE